MKILVVTDIQGNLVALDAVLGSPPARDAESVVCLGDVASGPQPGAVIARLQSLDAVVVRGNMDDVIASGRSAAVTSPDDQRFADFDAWCTRDLTESAIAWLESLPLTAKVELGHGRSLLACHGSPHSNEDAIGAGTPEAVVRELIEEHPVDVVAIGHLHVPMLRRVGERIVLHPGSVGWPAPTPDGRRPLRAEFAILEGTHDGVSVCFHQVAVPRSELRRAVRASGMPHGAWYLDFWRMGAPADGAG